MRIYHIVHLPWQLEGDFVYYAEAKYPEGIRVLVNFNRKELVGILGKSVDVSAGKISYKPILEVLDTTPLLDERMIELGTWMAGYYHCSLGKALFAMLPSLLQPEVKNTISLINEPHEVPEYYTPLISQLKTTGPQRLDQLRQSLKGYPLYKMLEGAEAEGWIEVKRPSSHTPKPKTVNFIDLLRQPAQGENFTDKQEMALAKIQARKAPFPLSEISDEISYAIIKALVKKGILCITPRKIETRISFYSEGSKAKEITLTDEQSSGRDFLIGKAGEYSVTLLYGITGSGKTEIYIELMKHYLALGKGIIFLIPEIALTPQMVERFVSVFGAGIAIMHSQLSERERYEEWIRLKEGKCRIALGARSAIFSPIRELGLIIVDEEHEQSYKQDHTPRYHGRDLAVVRARMENAQVVLGSATPSLESWHNAQTGKYHLQVLSRRPVTYKLPRVQILDLCNEPERELLSQTLLAAIMQALENKEQIILFQNRRGYASYIQCNKCGELITCKACEISMYYHKDKEEMNCHYCGSKLPVPRKCPRCGHYSFDYGASGTQKVESLLKLYFPSARILRLDSDSAHKKDIYKYMHDSMKNREADILLGTQMISKGLDFENVTLVGVILAEITLNLPDFRAAERTFQLLTQVAGRSGRGEKPGNVIIQTFNPCHYAIRHAQNQDYVAFATEELSHRQSLHYPPYYRLGRIVFQSEDQKLLAGYMHQVEKLSLKLNNEDAIILGPAPAPFSKLNKQYRYHLIIKAKTAALMSQVVNYYKKKLIPQSKISFYIDIDPLSLM